MVRDYLPVGFLNKIVGKLGISAEKFKKKSMAKNEKNREKFFRNSEKLADRN